MITVKSLTKSYGSAPAVDDVSFTASAGRVTGFLPGRRVPPIRRGGGIRTRD